MKEPSECSNIEEVRSAIDEIDRNIIKLFGERFCYAKCIVKFKDKNEKSIIAKERFDAVIKSRRELAVKNGLDADVIEKMYRILINYFIEEEIKLMNKNKN